MYENVKVNMRGEAIVHILSLLLLLGCSGLGAEQDMPTDNEIQKQRLMLDRLDAPTSSRLELTDIAASKIRLIHMSESK